MSDRQTIADMAMEGIPPSMAAGIAGVRRVAEVVNRWLRLGPIPSVAHRGRLPDFVGLGAQKAGTTTLHWLLQRHPEVCVPEEKEVHYFSLHYHRPLEWYAAKFKAAAPGQCVGEISPYYLFHPVAPARVAAALPAVKLIVLVRDPVERALSGYFHARRHEMEPLPIEAAFSAEADRLCGAERVLASRRARHRSHQWHSYLARSRYEGQLARYLAHFDRERLLLVRSEDLFANPDVAWRQIQEFLGLTAMPSPHPLPQVNRSDRGAAAVPAALRARLREALAPTYDAMRDTYGISWTAPDHGGLPLVD